MNTRDSHLSKAGPCRCLFLIGEARITHRGFGTHILLEHCLERTLPSPTQCRNSQRPLELLAGMSWQIQESVNLRHTDSLRTVSDFFNIIARTDFSLLQHAKVESWSAMFYEQSCHPRFIHSNADAVARHARLRHFKFSPTDAVSIADAYLIIQKSFDGKVFPELAERKIVAVQEALPVMIRIHLVDEHRAVLASVAFQVGLRIAIDIELAHHSPTIDWGFPD